MSESLSPSLASHTAAGPPRRVQKRSYVACLRCHALKVKCSGQVPCQRCQNAKKASSCKYPLHDRKVVVPESYLRQLRAGNQSQGGLEASPSRDHTVVDPLQISTGAEPRTPHRHDARAGNREIDESLHEPQDLFRLDQVSLEQGVSDSTCTAFSDHLLQCLQPQSRAASILPENQYVQNDAFARQLSDTSDFKLPDRIRATLLVRVTMRFIGQDYHFFSYNDFLQQLEKVYSSTEGQRYDAIWACKFFAVLALGELYSTATPASGHVGNRSVPGTDYFVTAVKLLQDQFEEPTTAQIETMLLFCFYSNALGRVKSAHIYSGLALRLSTSLGLHRSVADSPVLPLVEREHRTRLWWTVYIFDRSTSSRLGQPVSIQDTDIDVEMPSYEGMPEDVKEKFCSPAHLLANIELSTITGAIMRDIYNLPFKASPDKFVSNVRTILKRLRKWDANTSPSLSLGQGGVHRPAASLQLHFNQCIILTTRPILLQVLRIENPFSSSSRTVTDSTPPPISRTARTLAESCISAARTSSSILSQLFVENALATYGYFDAHHLFSSTLVLIISAIISPNPSDSDAVQTAFHLLKTMRDNGNTTASRYYSRLAHIQWSVGRLRAQATVAIESSLNNEAAGNFSAATLPFPDQLLLNGMDLENCDWDACLFPNSLFENYDWANMDSVAVNPLGDPLLQSFLGHTDASWNEDLDLTTEDASILS